jgi:hypothetical protein
MLLLHHKPSTQAVVSAVHSVDSVDLNSAEVLQMPLPVLNLSALANK